MPYPPVVAHVEGGPAQPPPRRGGGRGGEWPLTARCDDRVKERRRTRDSLRGPSPGAGATSRGPGEDLACSSPQSSLLQGTLRRRAFRRRCRARRAVARTALAGEAYPARLVHRTCQGPVQHGTRCAAVPRTMGGASATEWRSGCGCQQWRRRLRAACGQHESRVCVRGRSCLCATCRVRRWLACSAVAQLVAAGGQGGWRCDAA